MRTTFCRLIPVLGLGLLAPACSADPEPRGGAGATTSRPTASKPSPGAAGMIAAMESAHGVGGLYSRGPLHSRVAVEFGGKQILAGRMVHDAATGRTRIETEGGEIWVFDGEKAWTTKAHGGEGLPPRFHLLTWSYFQTAPWKFGDPGVRVEGLGKQPLRGEPLPSFRATFTAGTGDTPDDFYVAYLDPASSALRALGYIVTYGRSAEVARQEPHAAVYESMARVDGLAIPSGLTFWNWTEAGGIEGERIGTASFEDIRFGPAAAEDFRRPEGSVEDKLP